MAIKSRQIIKIDEDRCNGCGLCVSACAEGALQIVDGKAKLVSETYCDGLGACLGDCPMDAITIETREAEDFDEQAVLANMAAQGKPAHNHDHHPAGGFVCPSAKTIDRTHDAAKTAAAIGSVPSELRQWPIKLYLVNPQAPYFSDAHLLVAADCVPFAYGGVHSDFIRGKTIVTGCPKFDDTELYLSKLTDILSSNDIKSVTVLKMEVPCCGGMQRITEMAMAASGKSLPIETVTISLDGAVK
ncbi:MAG: 4Fe-4S binding protein [Armatimonadetes bacterium]|nr:4Fe-4S binding protein [Armatimonadota bacterium]